MISSIVSPPATMTSHSHGEDPARGAPERRQGLRKRRLDLNALSSLSRPLVCRHQHCGVRLRDGESLDWHYQAHLQAELGRLDRGVRVRRNPEDFPDTSGRRNVRTRAYERIRFRREARYSSLIDEFGSYVAVLLRQS